jgi:hypothetical protein
VDYPKSIPNVGLVSGKFVDEDVVAGVVGSLIPSSWGNAVTDELRGVIVGAGITPDEADVSQVLKAIRQIIASWLTGSGSLATPSRFDNSTKVATTGFVQRALGNFSFSQQLTSAASLDAGYCGQNIWCAGSANYAVTLPSVGSVATGSVLYFWSSNPGTVTLNKSGTDNIFLKSTSVNSITLGDGDSLYLVSNPAIGWIAFGGSKQIGSSASFSASASVNGYQRLPSGLIECRGKFTASSTAGAATPVTFPLGFTTVHSLVITADSSSASSVTAWYDSLAGSGFNGHSNLANVACTYIAKGY